MPLKFQLDLTPVRVCGKSYGKTDGLSKTTFLDVPMAMSQIRSYLKLDFMHDANTSMWHGSKTSWSENCTTKRFKNSQFRVDLLGVDCPLESLARVDGSENSPWCHLTNILGCIKIWLSGSESFPCEKLGFGFGSDAHLSWFSANPKTWSVVWMSRRRSQGRFPNRRRPISVRLYCLHFLC